MLSPPPLPPPLPQDFHYSGGQYCFLCIPEISLFEWHPFSISSAPHQPTVTLHVRVLGSWTRALHKLALKKQARAASLGGDGLSTNNATTVLTAGALMEGPCGSVAVDIHGPRHDMFMLIRFVCARGGSCPGQPSDEDMQFPFLTIRPCPATICSCSSGVCGGGCQ